MELNKALEKFNGLLNLDKNKNQPIRVDSYAQVNKYGVNLSIITLFSNMPKFYANNEELKTSMLSNPVNLIALQKLESILYTQGIAALREDFTPAEVLDIKEIKGEIKELKTQLEFNNRKQIIKVIETYKKENGVIKFNYEIIKPSNLLNSDLLKVLHDDYNYQPTEVNKIPYSIFYNNFNALPDLAHVNDEYFELLNRDMSVLLEDSFVSAPWLFVPDTHGMLSLIKNNFRNLKERIVPLNPQSALYSPMPINMVQAQSQSPVILNKIKETLALVKKFAFLKQDSSDFGTKNMHNVEAQELNSDFEDYIEQKANLREYQLLDFLTRFYPHLNISKVLVYGSTAWLINEATKYQVNQQGAQINKNAVYFATNSQADQLHSESE